MGKSMSAPARRQVRFRFHLTGTDPYSYRVLRRADRTANAQVGHDDPP